LTYTTKLIATATVFFAVVLFCANCSSPKQVGPKLAGNWVYTPYEIEIHPLSRFRNTTNPDEETMIVVHVEFRDGDGFACRGMGALSVSIIGANGTLLATELVSLQDPEVNRQRFDSVTRTYRVHFNKIPKGCKRVTAKASLSTTGEKTIKSQSRTIKNNN